MDAERIVGGRYHLRSRIGAGGMGTVWRAFDDRLHREVAIKEIVISATLASTGRDAVTARALAEARNAARLDHPNIVSVHDVLSDDDNIWIVMTLVVGRSLQETVDTDGPLSSARTAELGLGLLAALDAAHAAGVVHRDVKPSNVMLPDAGGVMLTDFSIAAAADAAGITQTGILLGTPGYVAPERVATGSSRPPVDLFGLGATLYFAIEGRGPFDRDTPLAALFAAVNEPHPALGHAGALTEVIDGLLVKAPGERWTSARCREPLRRVSAGNGGFAVGRSAVGPRPPREPWSGEPSVAPVVPPAVLPAAASGSRRGLVRPRVVASLASVVLLATIVAVAWAPAGRLIADLSRSPADSVGPTGTMTTTSPTPRTTPAASPTTPTRPPPVGDLRIAKDGNCEWYTDLDNLTWVRLQFAVTWTGPGVVPRNSYQIYDNALGEERLAGSDHTDRSLNGSGGIGPPTGNRAVINYSFGNDPSANSRYAGKREVRFTVRIDVDSAVDETNESNNTLVIVAGPFGTQPPARIQTAVRVQCRVG